MKTVQFNFKILMILFIITFLPSCQLNNSSIHVRPFMLDEMTITGNTRVTELKGQNIEGYVIKPEDLGLQRSDLDNLKVSNLQENAEMLRSILAGNQGPQRDIVLMNTAAVLLAGDKVETFQQGIAVAKESIDTSRALSKLEQLIAISQTVVKQP